MFSSPAVPSPVPFTLDSRRLPFGAPGALLGVSAETRVDPERFFIRTLHRFSDPRELFALGLGEADTKGTPTLNPARLTLAARGAARLELAYAGPGTLRLRIHGAALRLTQKAGVSETVADSTSVFIARILDLGLAFRFRALSGRLDRGHGGRTSHPDRLWLDLAPPAGGAAELLVEELVEGEPDPAPALAAEPFDSVVARREAEFADWRARFAATLPATAQEAALTEAAYILWAFRAGPRGPLKRSAVLMSKNWMTAIWSWDNCFNARALAAVDPALAWDQFMFFFDHQSPGGRFPDLITAFYTQWGMTKPPVYGWTLRHLRKHAWFQDPVLLAQAYEPIARQTRFWFEQRDSDGDGLPEYGHGCDSGWDNGTGFDDNLPSASPDLAAWLLIQLEELADLAPRVGRAADAAKWDALAERLLASLRRHCWDGRGWRAVRAGDHRPSPHGDSLLPWLVGLAGHRLTVEERAAVVAALSEPGRFLTAHGVATESVRSSLYEPDGYWRGPIWGPSTVVASEAAAACGCPDLAAEIARRFVAMAPAHGFAENHDAISGAPLRDPAYSWTASAWTTLQQDWLS